MKTILIVPLFFLNLVAHAQGLSEVRDLACADVDPGSHTQFCIAHSVNGNIYLHYKDLLSPKLNQYQALEKHVRSDGSVYYRTVTVDQSPAPEVGFETVMIMDVSTDPEKAATGTTIKMTSSQKTLNLNLKVLPSQGFDK